MDKVELSNCLKSLEAALEAAPEAAPVVEVPTDPHDRAYWAHRREQIAEKVAGLHSRPIEQLSQAERDRVSTVLWNEFWPLFGLVERLYTERPVEAPKPPRQRRARVPKAVMPEVSAPDAA
jgi:hypothetical protein